MIDLAKLTREPLLHFLAAGLTLFILFELVSTDPDQLDNKIIIVDRDALLTLVQYRSKAFQPDIAAARLDALSEVQLSRLVQDYVREEALHREALALGMDANDYVIKQRLIQSIEFTTTGFVTAAVELSEADVEAYFEANKEVYYVEPYVTFTHVFFGNERHGRDRAEALAGSKLEQLNRDRVPFTSSPRHGDRFLYHVNYVERAGDFVASHFSAAMAGHIFALEPDDQQWHGPFESEYGFHLVMLTRKTAGGYPELSEIQGRVVDDARRAAIRKRSESAIEAIVDTYEVRVSYQPVNAAAISQGDMDQ